MTTRERVQQPAQVSNSPALLQPPWQPAGATVTTVGDGRDPNQPLQQQHQQQQNSQTEVDEFEPLPDSPNGARTAAGRTLDQHLTDDQQQPAAGATKLPDLQSLKRPTLQAPAAATNGPSPGNAHVHLIGEITGAVGLGPGPLYCTWQLVYDTRLWSVSGRQEKGRTHASSPLLSEDGQVSGVVWECPVDILLTTSSMQQWPSIVFKLFHRSVWLGRDEFVGYSLCSLPNTPGCHHVSCPVWVAAECRRSLYQELTKFFTGLHPQLVEESFITDMEQRYEQGQHLHTVACSSSSSSSLTDSLPYGRAMVRTGGSAGASASGYGALFRPHCSSISAASRGATAIVGSGICLRLHVLTRGLERLGRHRGEGGPESIGHCLERLHSSVEKMRRQHARPKLQELIDRGSGDDDSLTEAAEESQGVQLVRQGRAARMEAVHRQLFGGDSDRARDRDRDQQQQQPVGGRLSSAAARSPAGSPSRMLASSSTAASPAGRAATGADTGSGSPVRLRTLASLPQGGSGPGPARRFSSSTAIAGSAVAGRGEAGVAAAPGGSVAVRGSAWAAAGQVDGPSSNSSPSGQLRASTAGAAAGAGGSSPLRRDAAAVSSRWAGRFASASGSPAGGQAAQRSPTLDEPLLPLEEEQS